jgi:hypothetical protein
MATDGESPAAMLRRVIRSNDGLGNLGRGASGVRMADRICDDNGLESLGLICRNWMKRIAA